MSAHIYGATRAALRDARAWMERKVGQARRAEAATRRQADVRIDEMLGLLRRIAELGVQ